MAVFAVKAELVVMRFDRIVLFIKFTRVRKRAVCAKSHAKSETGDR